MSLNQVNNPMIGGMAVFYSATGLAVLVLLSYYYKTREVVKSFNREEYDLKYARISWLYLSMIFLNLFMASLYFVQYNHDGFSQRTDGSYALWLRWQTIAIVGGILVGQMQYYMIQGVRTPGQSFWAVLTFIGSIASLYRGETMQQVQSRLNYGVLSIILYVAFLAMLYIPHDNIWGEEWEKIRQLALSEKTTWYKLWWKGKLQQNEASILWWAFIYRMTLLVFLTIAYIIWILTWFLADTNGFTNTSNLYNTSIAYLVGDVMFLIPFLLIFATATFLGATKHLQATDRSNGHVHIGASHSESYDSLLS
jgi:hypothetical protein